MSVRVSLCVADVVSRPGPCGNTAAFYVSALCEHEHLREGELCSVHVGQLDFCRVCHELPGDQAHDCALITWMRPVTTEVTRS